MALLAFDGFESYTSLEQLLKRSGFLQWTQIALGSNPAFEAGPFGGRLLHFPIAVAGYEYFLNASLGADLDRGFLGFRANLKKGNLFLCFTDTKSAGVMPAGFSSCFIVVLSATDGSIRTSVGNTPNNVFPLNSDVFFEIGFYVNGRPPSTVPGTLVIKVNNVVVGSFSGNTQRGPGNDAIDVLPENNLRRNRFGASDPARVNGISFATTGILDVTLDDFYVCDNVADAAAPGTNTFLGDCRVIGCALTGDALSPQGWVPSSAQANWQNVLVDDGDASYNSSTTPDAQDLFNISGLPANVGHIFAVQVLGAYRKTDASAGSISQTINSAGVQKAAPPRANIANTYATYTDIFVADPATNAAWLPAAVAPTVLKVGYRVNP